MPPSSLPNDFLLLAKELIPCDQWDDFITAIDAPSALSLRENPYKKANLNQTNLSKVPWSLYGYYLDQRPVFTLDPLLHAGTYYVGEASSMFIEQCFTQVIQKQIDTPLRVLDLCAAPGGKSTHIASLIGTKGVLVSNEAIRSRATILAENSTKWGIGNNIITNNDPAHFGALAHHFNVLLVDAPCSGEGMFRKQPSAREQWSLANVDLCAARQRRILSDSWDALSPGGFLLYSTCTFNQRENEENLQWMIDHFDTEPTTMDIPSQWGVTTTNTSGYQSFRFFPHKSRGEGFFLTLLRKADGGVRYNKKNHYRPAPSLASKAHINEACNWVNTPEEMRFFDWNNSIYACYASTEETTLSMLRNLRVLSFGTEMGQIFKGTLKPSPGMAFFHQLNRSRIHCVEMDKDNALDILRRNNPNVSLFQEGMNLACYKGHGIAFIKRIGGRTNNLYPKEYRIVHL